MLTLDLNKVENIKALLFPLIKSKMSAEQFDIFAPPIQNSISKQWPQNCRNRFREFTRSRLFVFLSMFVSCIFGFIIAYFCLPRQQWVSHNEEDVGCKVNETGSFEINKIRE